MIIVTVKNFDKAFAKLPKRIKELFLDKIEIFKIDPYNNILKNHQLKGSFKNYGSINITGDYRLIYEQYDDVIVRLIDIGTHSQIYGK